MSHGFHHCLSPCLHPSYLHFPAFVKRANFDNALFCGFKFDFSRFLGNRRQICRYIIIRIPAKSKIADKKESSVKPELWSKPGKRMRPASADCPLKFYHSQDVPRQMPIRAALFLAQPLRICFRSQLFPSCRVHTISSRAEGAFPASAFQVRNPIKNHPRTFASAISNLPPSLMVLKIVRSPSDPSADRLRLSFILWRDSNVIFRMRQAAPVIIFSPCPTGTTGRPFPFPSKKRSFGETAKALASTSFLNETPARRACSPNRRDLIPLGMTKGMEPHHQWASTRPSKNARRA